MLRAPFITPPMLDRAAYPNATYNFGVHGLPGATDWPFLGSHPSRIDSTPQSRLPSRLGSASALRVFSGSLSSAQCHEQRRLR